MLSARRFVPWGISFAMVLVVGCSQSGRQGAALRGDERVTDVDSSKLIIQLTAAQKDARVANERVKVASEQLRRHIHRLAAIRDPNKVATHRACTPKSAHAASVAPQKRVMARDATATRPPWQPKLSAKPKKTRPPVK